MNYGLGNVSAASLNTAASTYSPWAKNFSALTWDDLGTMASDVGSSMKSWSQSGYTSLASAGISAVGSMVSGYYQSRTMKIQYQMQQRAAEFNARQAERSAQAALMVANAKVGQISEKFEKVKASQKASMAANGVVLGYGSSAEVVTSTDINKRRSIDNEVYNGYERANAYRIQGANASVQAAVANTGSYSAFQGLGAAADSLSSGYRDYLYINNKNRLGS